MVYGEGSTCTFKDNGACDPVIPSVDVRDPDHREKCNTDYARATDIPCDFLDVSCTTACRLQSLCQPIRMHAALPHQFHCEARDLRWVPGRGVEWDTTPAASKDVVAAGLSVVGVHAFLLAWG